MIKEELKRYLEPNENENKTPTFMGHSKSSPKREILSNTGLPQVARKISNKQSNITHKGTKKRKQQTNPKVSRRKEIIKIRVEINEIESKK